MNKMVQDIFIGKVVKNDMVRNSALVAIERLDIARGFNNVEIIVRDNVPFVIDVNSGRIAGQDENIRQSGVNMAELYLDLALGKHLTPIEVPIGAISLKIKMDIVINEEELNAIEKI